MYSLLINTELCFCSLLVRSGPGSGSVFMVKCEVKDWIIVFGYNISYSFKSFTFGDNCIESLYVECSEGKVRYETMK